MSDITAEQPADLTAEPTVVDTPANPDGIYADPSQAFRFLNWVASDPVRQAFSLNLAKFSAPRQQGVADLVRNGLVSERRWVGGECDGRTTYRLTALGEERLAAAREAAALVVVG